MVILSVIIILKAFCPKCLVSYLKHLKTMLMLPRVIMVMCVSKYTDMLSPFSVVFQCTIVIGV